jgi:RNA polymerase sigma factor (sigma-70 family)
MRVNTFNKNILALRDNLKQYAISLTENIEDAEDLLQETFLKALLNKDKYKDNTNLKAWMYTIMKNTFINGYRRKRNSQTFIDKTDNKYFINKSDQNGFNTTESLISEEEINIRIDSLDEEFKQPFQMFTDGFKYKEIAEKLDIPIGTVKSRIFFGRKKLSSGLKEYR